MPPSLPTKHNSKIHEPPNLQFSKAALRPNFPAAIKAILPRVSAPDLQLLKAALSRKFSVNQFRAYRISMCFKVIEAEGK